MKSISLSEANPGVWVRVGGSRILLADIVILRPGEALLAPRAEWRCGGVPQFLWLEDRRTLCARSVVKDVAPTVLVLFA